MNINKTLESTLKYYHDGYLSEAEFLCREILGNDPHNLDALLMLGVISQQYRNYDLAISYTEKALRIDPSHAIAHYNLGVSFQESGQAQKAVSCYQRAIKFDPNFALAYFNLGAVQQERNDLDNAMEYYRKALHLDPALVSAYYNMGSVFQEKGRFEEAIIYYRKALQLNPEFGDAWNSMGVILQGQGMLDESIMHYQKALEIDPNFADAYYNIGKALQQKGCLNEAVVNYQKALQLNPDSAEVHNNIGFCFHEKGQNDEALSHFQKAIDLNPEFAEAYYNLALNYHDKKMIKKAIEYYEKAIECKNDFVRAHWNMSCALLLSGDFERGWKEYEWRWKLKEHRGYRTTHTRWDGSDIAGQTILLHAEQGFGDTIQFIRYAPLVAQRGARVIVQCPKELLPLIRKVKGIEQVLSKEGQMPKFDLQCPLLSLPLLFGTTLENIPCEIPYISADLSLFRNWRALLRSDSSMLKVGLVWSGRTKGKREHRRSCPLSFFSAFTQFDNIMFYSLQKGDGSEEAKMPPKGMRLIDCQEDLHDFSDTAALIANLDLIVSVDTAVAHLAGSLGKPVWTMLPFIPDWRWLLNRDDSPWYPTMRLFRQPSPGDWQSVIGHMEKALIEYVNR